MKKSLVITGIIAFFLVLSYAFTPQVLEGKIVNQSDISGYLGMSHEATSWDEAHPDDKTAWTNSMFGGMPTIMLTGNKQGDFTQKIYNLFLLGRRPASYLFILLVGAFLLMLSLGIDKFIAAIGAIAVAFCSYNFQIIQVGHNSKMLALAFLPWVLAAVIFTYRSSFKPSKWLPKTLLGAALFALSLSLQIKANHVQISYYLAIIIFSFVVVLPVWLYIRRRELIGRFFAASGLLLVLGILGIGTNANNLIPVYEYTQHTMRGGSELSKGASKGLELDYATSWSYGWEELPNMLIPDFNGGSSAGAIDPSKSETIKLLRSAGQTNVKSIAKSLPLYWGPQPFTAGPMYMGAITIFLFILGLCLYEGHEKWWLLIPTVIGILLAVGSHFMPFTSFWYHYMPFYSKFRTVSMALVILQFTLPMLGFLTLDRILMRMSYDHKKVLKAGLGALGITGGLCALCALIPSIAGSFTGASDAQQPDILVSALISDRKMLLTHDAITSLLLILATFALIIWAMRLSRPTKGDLTREYFQRAHIVVFAICALVLLNMFTTGRRYLNADHFVTEKNFTAGFAPRPVDKHILADETLDYRVLDLTANVFNDAHPSYLHKNIGGYSPVKLQRYQDLIDRYLAPEINSIYKSIQGCKTVSEAQDALPELPLLSMLNTKYIILDDNAGPVENPYIKGNAWFVGDAVKVATPDEEISKIGEVDLSNTLVVNASEKVGADNGSGSITLSSYAPNELQYTYTGGGLAVFSEIYHPGWTAHLEDGTPVELLRGDWIFRAAALPEGPHTLTMRYEPSSYLVGARLSRLSSLLLILLLLGAVGIQLTMCNRKKSTSSSF